MAGSRGDGLDARFQPGDHLLAAIGNAERAGDLQDVVPDVGQCVGGERHDARMEPAPTADCLFDFGHVDRADFALGLCEDDIGPQLLQLGRVDVIDRQGVLQEGVDFAVDLRAGGLDVQLRSSANGKAANGGREITFMRPSDELLAQVQFANDFRTARQQRDDARRFHYALVR